MRIGIITPAPPGSTHGNRITALRWAGILKRLGHRVTISREYQGQRYDLLLALHARRSYPSIKRFNAEHPELHLIVALTGTDLYRDLRKNQLAHKSLEVATRIVALQSKALEELRPKWKEKTRVIYQSAALVPGNSRRDKPENGNFDVCVIGHLRAVKDPFRAAMAARLLPASSRIRILQVGRAMTPAMEKRAGAELRRNDRYHWFREQSRSRTLRILAQSRLCVISSRLEGGANVMSEAIVASVPILASRVAGNVGILGKNYPGLFTAGNTQQLARLLRRAECDAKFLSHLKSRVKKLTPLFDPAREEKAWSDLISELATKRPKKTKDCF
jgi:putative glycosyltransferase (TIGR04348 family)